MGKKQKKPTNFKEEAKTKTEQNPLAEMKELLQRTQAQFENFRKQTDKRNEEIHKMAARNIVSQLLPIIDTFDLALKNTESHEEFVQGISLIHSQLLSMLKNNNVSQIESLHKLFNPNVHEALMKTESNEPENTVIEEFAKGYAMHEVIIRHAKVKLSAGTKNENKEEKNNTITEE